jgi:hypothetical protein
MASGFAATVERRVEQRRPEGVDARWSVRRTTGFDENLLLD